MWSYDKMSVGQTQSKVSTHAHNACSVSDQLSTKFGTRIITYRKNGRLTSSFHCYIRAPFNFLHSKSESCAIICLQTIRDEMSACKNLLSSTDTLY